MEFRKCCDLLDFDWAIVQLSKESTKQTSLMPATLFHAEWLKREDSRKNHFFEILKGYTTCCCESGGEPKPKLPFRE